jgi:hypothetical protein
MTSWKNLLLLFSITINIAVVATLFYFWGRHDGMRRLPALLQRPDRDVTPPGPLWKTMGLQEPQKRELEKLRAPFNAQMDQIVGNMEQNRRRLMEVMLAHPASQDSIKSLLLRLAENQSQLDRQTVEHLLALRPFLDERQWRMMLMAMARENRQAREMRPYKPFKRF